jgi:hypothetical protein
MNGYTSSGQWNDLKITATPATVKKYDDKAEIYFTVDTIHLKATISDSKDVLKDKSFGAYFLSNIFSRADIQAKVVEGTFYFKDINTIKNGIYANYNNDRIVFYQNDYTGKDFTGYVSLSSSYLLLLSMH